MSEEMSQRVKDASKRALAKLQAYPPEKWAEVMARKPGPVATALERIWEDWRSFPDAKRSRKRHM